MKEKNEIVRDLFEMQDLGYREFHSKLIPNIDPELIIGVRTPVLRKYAKDFSKNKNAKDFLKNLPHIYYEENNLHAFVLEQIKDFDNAIFETDRFLPYIDNWATCDLFFPKVFKSHADGLLPHIYEWLKSDKTYTVRYAIGLLMRLYLDERFERVFLEKVACVNSNEYYINMMISWFFATALAKQYDTAAEFLTKRQLSKWVHNKTIQKATESNRISPETKAYLKTLKIK